MLLTTRTLTTTAAQGLRVGATYRNRLRWIAAVGAMAALGLAGSPASAAPTGTVTTINPNTCALERVGTQFVKCDVLTGAGVAAQSWVPVADGSNFRF